MKLIPEQVANIKKEIVELEKKIGNYAAYYADRNTAGAAKSPGNQYGDFFTEHGLDLENDKLRNHRAILSNNEFMYDRNYEQISCGTKFKYCFIDEPSNVEEGIIAYTMAGLSSYEGFISYSSNLSKAVYGHKTGDVCVFKGADDLQVIRILDIEKNQENYVNFIRSVPYNKRRSWRERCEIKEEINNYSNEYQKRKNITVSQRELLKEELERIASCLKNENLITSKRRIAEIKNYLNNRRVATPYFDGSIDVGVRFKVTLMNKDGSTVTKCLEMINVALGDELDCDYIERISSLGSVVYGLRDGDEFTYFVKGIGNVSGYVHDIQTRKINEDLIKNQYVK